MHRLTEGSGGWGCTSGAGPDARFGAISFLHRFGSSLNANFHYHAADILDGDFLAAAGDGTDNSPRPCHRGLLITAT